MEKLRERLERALRQEFDGMEVDFGPQQPMQSRLSGMLTWNGFRDEDFTDRQRRVWDVIRDALGADSAQVSTLVTLTPDEVATYSR